MVESSVNVTVYGCMACRQSGGYKVARYEVGVYITAGRSRAKENLSKRFNLVIP
jgi:hypothetical protein